MQNYEYLCCRAFRFGGTRKVFHSKFRKKVKIWSVRKARWRRWMKFGVDWEFVEMQNKIADIKHARRVSSPQKCKNFDAREKQVNKLKVTNLTIINKPPKLCVKPRLPRSKGKAKLFKKKTQQQKLKKIDANERQVHNCLLYTSPSPRD